MWTPLTHDISGPNSPNDSFSTFLPIVFNALSDGIIDFVSSKSSLELGLSLLGNGGRLLTLGGSGKSFISSSSQMLDKELELIGSKYCTKQEVKDSLDLYAKGLIKPMISKISNFDGAESLHRDIEESTIVGRAGLII